MNAQVVHVKNPIRLQAEGAFAEYEVSERITVAEWLGRSRIDIDSYPTLCHINGDTDGIMRADYATTYIEDGDAVFFSVLPCGGDGGSNPLMILAMIVLIVITWGAASALAAGAGGAGSTIFATGAGLTTLGQATVFAGFTAGLYLINRFLGPDLEGPGEGPGDLFTLNAAGNPARKGEPMTVLYGRDTFPPDYLEPPWGKFQGQAAIPDSSNARNRAEHFLSEVFFITKGECDVENVLINDTDVDGFAEVEYAIRGPGQNLELVPRAVWPNPLITSAIQLRGPNETDGGGDFYKGQTEPAVTTSYRISIAGSDNDTGSGTAIIALDTGTHPAVSWGVDSLVGQQIWLGNTSGAGGAQGSSTNYNDGSSESLWNNVETGNKSDRLAHPDRLRTIVSNTATTITVRPPFTATSIANPAASGTLPKPEDAGPRFFHIRQDYTPAYAVCPPGETVRAFHFDITGSPIRRTNSKGRVDRFGVGIRAEYREVDDSDNPVSGAAGEWTGVYRTWTNWGRTLSDIGPPLVYSTHEGWIRGSTNEDGRRRSRHANVPIWGAGGTLHPVALSFRKRVPKGRYQVRFSRKSEYSESTSITNIVFLAGVRGELVGAERSYPDATVLEMVSKGTSALNASSGRQVRVKAIRKIPNYGAAASGTLPTDPITTFLGEFRVRINKPNHQLVLGQLITITGAAATGGISAGNLNLTNEAITAIIDENTFEYWADQIATSEVVGGGSSMVITASAGWTGNVPTTSPMWALADACRNTDYGGAKPDSELDLDAFVAINETALSRGDEFNGVFKDARSMRKAFGEIARVCRSKVVKPNGVITPVRDEPRALRSAMYTGRNIHPGSFGRVYTMTGDESPDGVEVVFKNRVTGLEDSVKRTAMGGTLGSNPLQTFNTEARVRVTRTAHRLKVGSWVDISGATAVGGIAAEDLNIRGTVSAVIDADTFEYTASASASSGTTGGGSAVVAQGVPKKPARMEIFGITEKEHAHREAMYYAADHEHRRLATKLMTDVEGYLPVVGEMVGESYPMPRWGQAGDLVGKYGPQLHPNPTFDVNTSNWSVLGADATLTHNKNEDHILWGSGSAKVECVATAGSEFGVKETAAVTTFTQGTKYRAFIRVKGAATAIGKTFSYKIEERDGGGSQAQSTAQVVLDGTWQRLEVAHTIVNTGITDVWTRASIGASAHAIGDVFYLDGAFIALDDVTLPTVLRCDQNLVRTKGPEILSNPGFVTDTSGWVTVGSPVTLTRVATDGIGAQALNEGLDRDVTQSDSALKCTADVGFVSSFLGIRDSTSITVFTQGATYTASCWVLGEGSTIGKECFLILREAGGVESQDDKTVQVTLTAGWQRLEVTKSILESDRTDMQVIVGIGSSPAPAAGDDFYVDTVSCKRDDTSVAHFVGLKKNEGDADGALAAGRVQGQDDLIELSGALTWTPEVEGGSRERTQFSFGIADEWLRDVVVLETIPRSFDKVEIIGEVESALVHSADGATYVPPEDDSPQRDPDAPIVTNVVAHMIGPDSNRQVVVSWTAAPGAHKYVVEQASGTQISRSIPLVSGIVNNGPFSDTKEVRTFALPSAPPSTAVFSSEQNTVKELSFNYAGHGLSVGDWFYVQDQSGGCDGVPVGEINGAHQVKTVVSADRVKFETTTTPSTGSIANLLDSCIVSLDEKGGLGEVDGDQDTTTENLRYFYASGDEFAQYLTIVEILPEGSGNTAGAYAITGGPAEHSADSTVLGETEDTQLAAFLVNDGDADTADKIIRVQAVGRLYGPWVEAVISYLAASQTQPMFNAASGLVDDPGAAIGQPFKASGWVDPSNDPVDILTLPDNAIVTGVTYWIESENATGSLRCGIKGGDVDAFAEAIPAGTGTVGNTGRTIRTASGDDWQEGVQIRKIQPSGTVVQADITTVNTAGKYLVTVEYEIAPAVP